MGEAVGAWLESLVLGEYAESFADNRIDMDVLPELTADDLKDIGVRAVGDRRKLLGAIERLGEAPADVPLEIESFDASRRQVTVLFADISGYTALTHGLDAEDTHAILNRYFDAVDGVVRGHGGRIDKHIGDAVMAVFGAPIARTDDPERALRAALEIHDVVARLEPPIAVHIGVASGQVVASTTGSAAHGEYTVTGDSVNLAARLTDLAASGETYAADDMRRALGGRFAGEELGPRAIEGLDEPVIVWRLDAVALGARRRFVGRERELALFSAAFATAASHRAGTVFVLRGEPGIGKTHMLEEIANLGRGAGFTLLHGLTLDFGAAGGQSPVDGIVRDLLGIAGEGGKSARERAVDAVVGEGWIEEADLVHLNNMLHLDQEAGRYEAYAVMDNATRVLGRQRVVASLVAARAASAPLLIEIEDVHWAAPEVLAQFARLAAVVAELSAILVMTTRIVGDPIDDGFRAEADGVSIMTIDLPPLRAEEARRLAEDYTSVDPALLASCVSRSGGNPLFLEQLLRNLDELSADNLPGSIQGIVQARLDVLDNENRGAIQAASVLGQRFDPDALAHLLKREGFDPATLLRAALLRRAGADLHFAHALIRDGAYESLLKARRLELHRRAADWFAGRDPALHARHLDLAADAGAAAAYLMAVRHHAEVFQYDQAFSLADRGLELDSPAPTRFELVCTKGDLLRAIGRSAEAIELLGEKAASASGHEQTARVHIALALAARQASRYDDALASLEIAEAAAAALEAPLDLATIHYLRGNVYFPLGRIDKCLESSERAIHFARAADSVRLEVGAISGFGDANYLRGTTATASDYYTRAIDLARANGLVRDLAANLHNRSCARLFLGLIQQALDDAVESTELAGELYSPIIEVVGRLSGAWARMVVDDIEGALNDLGRSLEIAVQIDAKRFETMAQAHIARMLVWRGRRSDAVPLATTAVENALVTSRHFTGPIALGALALALEDPGEQDRILEQGRDVLAEGCVGHCYFFFHGDAIAILLERGDWESADRHAGALEAFTRAEPLGLIDFTIRQARLLAEAGRRGNEASLGAEFEALVRDARAMGIANTLTGLLDLPYRPGDTTSPGTIRSNRGNEGGNTWAKI